MWIKVFTNSNKTELPLGHRAVTALVVTGRDSAREVSRCLRFALRPWDRVVWGIGIGNLPLKAAISGDFTWRQQWFDAFPSILMIGIWPAQRTRPEETDRSWPVNQKNIWAFYYPRWTPFFSWKTWGFQQHFFWLQLEASGVQAVKTRGLKVSPQSWGYLLHHPFVLGISQYKPSIFWGTPMAMETTEPRSSGRISLSSFGCRSKSFRSAAAAGPAAQPGRAVRENFSWEKAMSKGWISNTPCYMSD